MEKTKQNFDNENFDPIERISLEYELLLNKRLYEKEAISLEVYEKIANKILRKINNGNLNKNPNIT